MSDTLPLWNLDNYSPGQSNPTYVQQAPAVLGPCDLRTNVTSETSHHRAVPLMRTTDSSAPPDWKHRQFDMHYAIFYYNDW